LTPYYEADGMTVQYEYGAAGNRTAYTATITQTTVTTYTYDAANRLIKRVVESDDVYLYTWSDAGRLTREE
jgi:YD repeat-containing protein